MNTRPIKGKPIDNNTRCVHYHSPLDIIAIKFRCCGEYYPCYYCHAETAGHLPEVWEKNEFDNRAIKCGICSYEMTIKEYLSSQNCCSSCNAAFNPKCSNHYHLYFEM